MTADLTSRTRALEAENRTLREEADGLRRENERLEKKLAELEERNQALTRKLAELSRAGKRQAAPFARRVRKAERRRPGRVAGHEGASQAVPEHVDEDVRAPLVTCPCCGGDELDELREHEQYVVDIPPVQQHVRRIVTESGYCRRCRKRVRTSHPGQVSTAHGAAKVALGPRVLGLAAELKHRYGMAYRDTADLLATYFGVRVTHSALVHASVRLAHRGQATYAALVEHVRSSAVVHTDDTGWRIDTDSAWLWVFATAEVTVYVLARSRGSDVVVSTLGEDFAGRLVSDGLPALDALDARGYHRSQCRFAAPRAFRCRSRACSRRCSPSAPCATSSPIPPSPGDDATSICSSLWPRQLLPDPLRHVLGRHAAIGVAPLLLEFDH